MKVNWSKEINNILALDKQGYSMVKIADHYGVSKQRVKQVCTQYNLTLTSKEVKRKERSDAYFSKWGDTNQDLYEIKRAKWRGKKANAKRAGVEFTIPFKDIIFPTHCPILGFELDYEAEERQENSPSFDRIDPSKGYVTGNVMVISWRANRIKNDGSAQEHRQIANFLDTLAKTSNITL